MPIDLTSARAMLINLDTQVSELRMDVLDHVHLHGWQAADNYLKVALLGLACLKDRMIELEQLVRDLPGDQAQDMRDIIRRMNL